MSQSFIEKSEVPEVVQNLLEVFFTPLEIYFVEKIDKDIFNKDDIFHIVHDKRFVKESYKRGLINIVDEKKDLYCLNNFYGKLDVFCVSEHEKYKTIDASLREKIDKWYFDVFYNGLATDQKSPTPDKIYLLDEMLEFIDKQNRPVYLNYCDCRSLTGECGLPRRTCITYKNGINTFVHRGLSLQIDKEKAKEIVKQSDKAGLMHTANPNGICNCCGDCCYLFRGQKRRKSIGVWPASPYIIDIDEEKCVGCGICEKRCHFDVFEIVDRKAKINIDKCVGCGICNQTCPRQALSMKGR